MEFKTTKKEVKNYYNNILSVGYCGMQYLLKGTTRESYIVSVYGWTCDNYKLTGTNGKILLLSTGYNPINDQNINKKIIDNKYNIIKKYEKKAEKINNNHNLTWQQITNKLNKLIIKFVDEILESEVK